MNTIKSIHATRTIDTTNQINEYFLKIGLMRKGVTVAVPRRADVGSGPTEHIKRTMTVMINVRIPAGFGMAIANAADSSITAHISPDT